MCPLLFMISTALNKTLSFLSNARLFLIFGRLVQVKDY